MLQSRRQTREITIVGGSLSGLTFALACANRGICTRVLERSQGQPQGGGALGVDWELLARVVGQDPRLDGKIALLPVITSCRQAVARSAIHRWLREQVLLRAEIALVEGVAIQAVVENSRCAMAIMTGGWQIDAPVIVGADGVQSVVRHAIDPGHPHPSYAGYLLWRGLVSERDLPRETHWPANGEGFGLMTTRSDYLVAYPVAGVDGALEPGKRQISFSWYDPTRADLLEASGCLSPTRQVLSSLAREHIPEPVRVELLGLARRIWPAPWRVFVTHALERHEFFATPVAEYFPRRLHGGRLAILGDAAHVVSPATGHGFAAGILDAQALADALAAALQHDQVDLPGALKHYASQRLRAAQTLAEKSVRWSRAYLRGTGRLPGSQSTDR